MPSWVKCGAQWRWAWRTAAQDTAHGAAHSSTPFGPLLRPPVPVPPERWVLGAQAFMKPVKPCGTVTKGHKRGLSLLLLPSRISRTPHTPPHRLSAAQFILGLVFTDQPKIRGVPSGGRGAREEIWIIGPLTSLGIVSSWELVGVVASSPIQGTEGKCYASCLQEGQDTTNEFLKKETYRKEREKKIKERSKEKQRTDSETEKKAKDAKLRGLD